MSSSAGPCVSIVDKRIHFKRSCVLTSFLIVFSVSQFLITDLENLAVTLEENNKIALLARQSNDKHSVSFQAEITFTNYGWHHPNPKKGLQRMRSMAMKSFHDAVIVHDRYNASAWNDLDQKPNPERTIFAFLDLDACQLIHWPIFAGIRWNSDEEGGRWPFVGPTFKSICPAVDQALQSPALAAPDSRLIVLSCMEFGPSIPCLAPNRTGLYSKLVVGHMSALKNQTHPLDFGLPPWPVKTVSLNQSQIDAIETCHNTSRSLLFAFVGRERAQFQEFSKYLKPLHGKNGIHAEFSVKHYMNSAHPENLLGDKAIGPVETENQTKDEFYNLLTDSIFAGAPLGDCAYSVRFSEVLSSGSIPVVYSDNWVLPYNRDVVDWSKIAVLLPQRRMNETLAILRSIPDKTRCSMSRKGYHFFKNYVADSPGRLKAVLRIMDVALSRRRLGKAPLEFSAMPE